MPKAKTVLIGVAVIGLSATLASADDVAAKKLKLKAGDPAKQQVQVLSKDEAADAGAPTGPERPTVGGASLHVYGAEIDQCFGLGPKEAWVENGNQFTYKVGNVSAKVKADYLKVKLKGIFGINANVKGTVNAIFRSGTGYELCTKCTGTEIKKDEDGKFSGKNCTAKACDLEVNPCPPFSPSGAFLD